MAAPDGGTLKTPRTEKEKTWTVIESNHEKVRRKNTEELLRYLRRESTVEEQSLLGTEQGNSGEKTNIPDLGKEKAESFPNNAGGETAGVTERGPKLQHLGSSRQTSAKYPRELNALWLACSSL